MPEQTEPTAENRQVAEPVRAEPAAAHKGEESSFGEHGGAYSYFRNLAHSAGGHEPPPEQFAPIFASSEYASPVNDAQRARALGSIQQLYGNHYVQRMFASSGSGESAPVQRQAAGAPDTTAAPPANGSTGHPLDVDTLAFMEPRLGRDLGDVRVHTDNQAAQAARDLSADAFTTGRDIYFAPGQYDPGGTSGRGLLAHELTHVVQQSQGTVSPGISQPGDTHERQAEAVQNAVTAGANTQAPGSPATLPAVQRQATPGAPSAPAPGAAPGAAPPAAPGDYSVAVGGVMVNLPVHQLIYYFKHGDKLEVNLPNRFVKFDLPFIKSVKATLDLDKANHPIGGSLTAKIAVPKLAGDVTGTIDAAGHVSASFDVAVNLLGTEPVTVRGSIAPTGYSIEGDVPFQISKVSGKLHYAYREGKHSGKGTARYEGSKFTGDVAGQIDEEGNVTGQGVLQLDLFKGLKLNADVDLDEKKNVRLKAAAEFPGPFELFPAKVVSRTLFSFDKHFPLWGFTIPVIDADVGLFADIGGSASLSAILGPGVIRNIKPTAEFGTDPEQVTEFGIGCDLFLPAGAMAFLMVRGGIGLGALIADIEGGVMAMGTAGIYGGLTVSPRLAMSGGKYKLSGTAELAAAAQLKLSVSAFAEVEIGIWRLKKTVWSKEWKLAEWIWNTGLNFALRASMSYTLGEDFAPDISYEAGDVDVEKLSRDAMPESGDLVSAAKRPTTPDKASFKVQGEEGTQAPAAPAPEPPHPAAAGAPPVKKQKAEGPVPAPGAPASSVAETPKLPPPPAAMHKDPEDRTEPETWQVIEYTVLAENQAAPSAPVQRATSASRAARYLDLDEAYARLMELHPGTTLTRAEFDELNKTRYFDPSAPGTNVRAKFRMRRYTIDGDYKIPKENGHDKPLIVPTRKAGTAFPGIRPDGTQTDFAWVLAKYQSKANSGLLRTFPREPRPDMPALWDGALNDKKVKTARDRTKRMDEVDHIVELQVGGEASDFANLQLLPQPDNGSSGATINGQVKEDMDALKTLKVKYKAVKQG